MKSPFASMRNVPIIGDVPRVTAEDMAAELASDTCQRLKELRAEAMAREENAEAPALESAALKECYATLEALCKGRHGWVVKPIIMELLPEVTRPANEMEQAAVAQYLADNPGVEAPKADTP